MKAIAAMALNRVIGSEQSIPWYLSEDFKQFKRRTMGGVLVMGRKTYESIGRPLPGRDTYVLTRQTTKIEGVTVVDSVESVVALSKETDKTVWIAGGAEVYKLFFEYCTDVYLTIVKKEYSGDTYLPEFESMFSNDSVIEDNDDFKIVHYKR